MKIKVVGLFNEEEATQKELKDLAKRQITQQYYSFLTCGCGTKTTTARLIPSTLTITHFLLY